MSKRMFVLAALLVFVGCVIFAYQGTKDFFLHDTPAPVNQAAVTQKTDKNSTATPVQVRMLAGGDMVFHPITYSPQYENVVPPYNFNRWFTRIAPALEEADYATVTFETVCDDTRAFNGYPVFNTPPEAITAIRDAGFDAYATATNHILDQGFDAMVTTLEQMDQAGVRRFGCKLDHEEATLIENVGGMNIAFLNYADAYNGFETALKADQRELISPLEIEKVCDDIVQAREAGADIVAVYPHWGVEYQTLPNQTQIDWAHQMAAAGADVIIGSHPHVVQPAEWVENDGRKTFIVYSLGNTMSNQRAEFLGTIDTEIGAFADLTFVKDENGARVESAALIPSTVFVNKIDGRLSYEVAFIDELLNDTSLSEHQRAHVQRLQVRAEEILAAPIPQTKDSKQVSA